MRDDRGQVAGALSKKNYGCFDPFLAECYTVREGLQFILAHNFDNLDVESDSLNAISAIKHLEEFSIVFSLIIDILKLSASLGIVSFSHILHQGNAIARNLAILAFCSICSSC
ncbi:Ribonuclease H-like domain containing protein [Trema orientale]|uniref:Ribonuclease H-like domain containing protein n=1 Tax=Trema orientale TaxID=63057 RepID=A0A2P5G0R8_TREOI|nr:Ribonuclease H-like domain containing protein [Trema orientale]